METQCKYPQCECSTNSQCPKQQFQHNIDNFIPVEKPSEFDIYKQGIELSNKVMGDLRAELKFVKAQNEDAARALVKERKDILVLTIKLNQEVDRYNNLLEKVLDKI